MEKVNWQPATKENEFVNEMWELFDGGEGKDNYQVSFEAMDCFFRNVFSWLNEDKPLSSTPAAEVKEEYDHESGHCQCVRCRMERMESDFPM